MIVLFNFHVVPEFTLRLVQERMLTVLDKEASMVMAALDRSVEDAKTQIASMHLGVASCWNASVPKALAALSLSPSEFDSYLNETQVLTKFMATPLHAHG